MGATLPLFPLETVLFPGLVLPLHVFEDRYRLLVRELHWDHSYGLEDFPEASVLVQRAELRYAFAPDPRADDAPGTHDPSP